MNPPQQIYLAPFQGITGFVFREVFSSHFRAVNKYFTPFLTSVQGGRKTLLRKKELAAIHHHSAPVVPQILSNNAEEIIRFGRSCHELGFQEINWNLGCPFPRVASKKRGSGLLPFPETVKAITQQVMRTLPLGMSVKCRLGYQAPQEILPLLEVFRECGISELIVHARIGKQLYKGETDLDAFEKVVAQAALPLAYNGDIFRPEDYLMRRQRFPAISRWMLGRGLLADPYLADDIVGMEAGTTADRKSGLKRFVDDLYYAYRQSNRDSLHSISQMKELWEYLGFSFDKPGKVFSAVKKTKSFHAYEDAVNRVFDEFEYLGSGSGKFSADSF